MVCSLLRTSVRFRKQPQMVDPFYGGAAHSSSYPPTHCMMASFPSSGDYRIVIVGRNWQLLPTTLASRSPRFIGYGVSYFGCYPSSVSESIFPPTLYEIRTHQSALVATNRLKSNVKERCSSRMPWHPSKDNDSIIHHSPTEVK